jgi:endonuclease/exonuclease/phosphatase family metal-dependent hydrolase
MINPDRSAVEQAMRRMADMPHLEAISCLSARLLRMWTMPSVPRLSPRPRVVFNIEQGTRLKWIIPFLRLHPELSGADIILANELDYGMARSNNLHTARELAQALKMNYAFGVEFVPVDACRNGNEQGLHGNAILSRFPLERVRLVHLPIEYEWFYREGDGRLGTRMALLAQTRIGGREVGVVCVHLENRASPEGRIRQFAYLLGEIDAHFGNLPVLIGGDMNTNTVDGDSQANMEDLKDKAEQYKRLGDIPFYEPMMALAEARGYTYKDCNLFDKSTRRKHMPGEADILLNLDWFFQRGLKCSKPSRMETIFNHQILPGCPEELNEFDGKELSDHDAVAVSFEVAK